LWVVGFSRCASGKIGNAGSFLFAVFNVAPDEFFYISSFVRDTVQFLDDIRLRSRHYFQGVALGVHAVKSFLWAFPLFLIFY
jgi:hypothetical protein